MILFQIKKLQHILSNFQLQTRSNAYIKCALLLSFLMIPTSSFAAQAKNEAKDYYEIRYLVKFKDEKANYQKVIFYTHKNCRLSLISSCLELAIHSQKLDKGDKTPLQTIDSCSIIGKNKNWKYPEIKKIKEIINSLTNPTPKSFNEIKDNIVIKKTETYIPQKSNNDNHNNNSPINSKDVNNNVADLIKMNEKRKEQQQFNGEKSNKVADKKSSTKSGTKNNKTKSSLNNKNHTKKNNGSKVQSSTKNGTKKNKTKSSLNNKNHTKKKKNINNSPNSSNNEIQINKSKEEDNKPSSENGDMIKLNLDISLEDNPYDANQNGDNKKDIAPDLDENDEIVSDLAHINGQGDNIDNSENNDKSDIDNNQNDNDNHIVLPVPPLQSDNIEIKGQAIQINNNIDDELGNNNNNNNIKSDNDENQNDNDDNNDINSPNSSNDDATDIHEHDEESGDEQNNDNNIKSDNDENDNVPSVPPLQSDDNENSELGNENNSINENQSGDEENNNIDNGIYSPNSSNNGHIAPDIAHINGQGDNDDDESLLIDNSENQNDNDDNNDINSPNSSNDENNLKPYLEGNVYKFYYSSGRRARNQKKSFYVHKDSSLDKLKNQLNIKDHSFKVFEEEKSKISLFKNLFDIDHYIQIVLDVEGRKIDAVPLTELDGHTVYTPKGVIENFKYVPKQKNEIVIDQNNDIDHIDDHVLEINQSNENSDNKNQIIASEDNSYDADNDTNQTGDNKKKKKQKELKKERKERKERKLIQKSNNNQPDNNKKRKKRKKKKYKKIHIDSNQEHIDDDNISSSNIESDSISEAIPIDIKPSPKTTDFNQFFPSISDSENADLLHNPHIVFHNDKNDELGNSNNNINSSNSSNDDNVPSVPPLQSDNIKIKRQAIQINNNDIKSDSNESDDAPDINENEDEENNIEIKRQAIQINNNIDHNDINSPNSSNDDATDIDDSRKSGNEEIKFDPVPNHNKNPHIDLGDDESGSETALIDKELKEQSKIDADSLQKAASITAFIGIVIICIYNLPIIKKKKKKKKYIILRING